MTINTNSYGWLLTIFYMSNAFASNSFRILSHFLVFVNPFFKDLVTHTGFEPMLTA